MNRSVVLVIALLCASTLVHAQSPTRAQQRIAGCWRADRSLGPGGRDAAIEVEQAWRTFVLQEGGRVALPLVPVVSRKLWGRSYWEARADSVTLALFTGTMGWSAELKWTADNRSLRGKARYGTDAIVVGATPIDVPVTLTRTSCDTSWPSVATNLAPLRPWQRGEPVHFSENVDQPATVVAGAPLPQGIIAVRALRYDESAKLDSSDARPNIARVVLQVIVESDGRVDSSGVKLRASDGPEYTARVLRALTALRFVPATRKGVAVHVLTHQRFELRR